MHGQRETASKYSAFVRRHIGPDDRQVELMLDRLGVENLDELIDSTIPDDIRYRGPFDLGPGLEEAVALDALRERASRNELFRSFIGMGYYGTITPAVVQRGVLENPAWYTAYTPYQAEISQGRLEALVNFQTLVCDLTGLEVANASLLDEATAAAEAMSVALQTAGRSKDARSFLVDARCHPHTVDVVETRARALGVEVRLADLSTESLSESAFGVLLQTPSSDGSICDDQETIRRAHEVGALVIVATDLLALTLIRPPGELGADMAVGSSQRFGVPMGFGGPHAGFLAARESLKRRLPGRIVGVSRDLEGRLAYRLALQTREQHIRREKATSNICTAQVLPAVLAAMYAVYHGPSGLQAIGRRVHELTQRLAAGVAAFGHDLGEQPFFDTLRITPCDLPVTTIQERARERQFNLRWFDDGAVGVSLDETTSTTHVEQLIEIFETEGAPSESRPAALDETILRTSSFLEHPVFQLYRSETEMMRYLHRLADKDLSLTRSMIALGSCTMKLNASSEMQPISWRRFAHLHPFAPRDQTAGYAQLFSELEAMLCTLTGFAAVSLQPNAGSQGEYAGLLAIRRHHEGRGEAGRRVCLIPRSAHGTNPASAVMAGMSVLPIACDDDGNIEVEDLRAKAQENRGKLAALMVTYPSTHGVFEESIREVCEVVHENGGQIYMDGANFNAMVGLCRPADLGVDVCHLNLHKTFCIPHGGGGPGVGPIGVAAHLVDSLPGHSVVAMEGRGSSAAVAAAPWGSASILPISWMYIRMMGLEGLERASRIAILNANYVAARLQAHYPILYTGANGRVAHECILDLRPLKRSAGVEVEDVAKRLIDYGFHAPTVSWPVAGTLMVEPTESESQAELDRFCEAMIAIREEVRAIERGELAVEDSALRHAPHPAETLLKSEWDRVYSREEAAYPTAWLRAQKYWPPVGRVDNVYGDRNLVCSCPPMEAYELEKE
jgi:glycine dehydrogenase